MTGPTSRPSDAERESVVARLAAAFADDRLSLDAYEQRVEDVYRAVSSTALAKLTTDLPVPAAPEPESTPVATRISAVFGSIERRMDTTVPRRLEVRASFANVELDLSDAQFREGTTEIAVRALCANVELRLPDGVSIEVPGGAVLGSFTAHAPPVALRAVAHPDRTVLVTGSAILSSVEVIGVERNPDLSPSA